MKIAIASLQSTAPYSQSRQYERDEDAEKLEGETHADYEKRTWRKRCHCDAEGNVFIPPSAFVRCIQEAATYVKMGIPGKGKQTYVKNFKAGLLITEPLVLPIKITEVEGDWLSLDGQGRRGGRGVWKCMPIIREWKGKVPIEVLDEAITPEVLEVHMSAAGRFIGIGRYRPINGGFYGRFKVNGIKWG